MRKPISMFVEEKIWRQMKVAAAERGKPLWRLVEEVLRGWLEDQKNQEKERR